MAEYIEREALLRVIRRMDGVGGMVVLDREEVEKAINNAPAADVVEVRHGRWIMRGGKRYCSACQKRACVTRDSEDFWYTVGTDYCPNCGERMEGE